MEKYQYRFYFNLSNYFSVYLYKFCWQQYHPWKECLLGYQHMELPLYSLNYRYSDHFSWVGLNDIHADVGIGLLTPSSRPSRYLLPRGLNFDITNPILEELWK